MEGVHEVSGGLQPIVCVSGQNRSGSIVILIGALFLPVVSKRVHFISSHAVAICACSAYIQHE